LSTKQQLNQSIFHWGLRKENVSHKSNLGIQSQLHYQILLGKLVDCALDKTQYYSTHQEQEVLWNGLYFQILIHLETDRSMQLLKDSTNLFGSKSLQANLLSYLKNYVIL